MNRRLNQSLPVCIVGLLVWVGCSHLNHTAGDAVDHAGADQDVVSHQVAALEQELIGLGPTTNRTEGHPVAAPALT